MFTLLGLLKPCAIKEILINSHNINFKHTGYTIPMTYQICSQDAQCIEITISQETEGPWDNNSSPDSESYSDHFPLTPPQEVVISQEQTVNGKVALP